MTKILLSTKLLAVGNETGPNSGFLGNTSIKRKDIQAVLSDIRLSTAHLYKGEYIPYGYNQFVVGGIVEMDGKIHKSFDALIKDMEDSANE